MLGCWRSSLGLGGEAESKITESQFIQSMAGEVSAELERFGIPRTQRITVAIEPDDWLADVRRLARARVAAEGWSDRDIHRIIEEEREAVQHRVK